MLKRCQLTTTKGSLTNACIIENDGRELLFSYQTLVGVWTDGTCYFQRDGLAGSKTTARHINRWAGSRNRKQVSETELNGLANL